MAWGYFKKLVIADVFAITVNKLYEETPAGSRIAIVIGCKESLPAAIISLSFPIRGSAVLKKSKIRTSGNHRNGDVCH